ncbi:Methionine aminopeptidase [uncultured archaeon]|nr:Methionine aminopeptidase [uncultured archaeon]
MNDEKDYDYEKLAKAGKVSFDALQYAKGLVRPDASLLEVSRKIEEFIKGKGMRFAFPVNLSINEQAAHYAPLANDETCFTENDVVKVDLGARLDDAAGDCALTVDLTGRYAKLVDATEEALEAALSTVKAGRPLNEIGRAAESVAKKHGFNPIRNLGGHGIEEGELHASIFVPNYDNGDTTVLLDGQVVAIEVFLTTGAGYVVDTDQLQIFQKIGPASPRSEDTRDVAAFIDDNFGTYPFAMRWLSERFGSEFKIRRALNELAGLGALETYPTLVEKTNGIVAQAEKEVIVGKDSCTVVTK